MRTAIPEPAGAGFQTTAFPYATAGASFPSGMAIGLFHGVTTASVPRGARRHHSPRPGSRSGS